jgi:hypothetical protein
VWYAIYIIVHLLLYMLILRHLVAFRREIVIFAYHAISFIAVGVAVTAGVVLAGASADLYGAVAIVALHAIYSISFLEVWSLSEGGYSLQIMEQLAQAERRGQPADMDALRAIGIAKQGNRLDGLASAGLVRQTDATVELTATGRCIATAFAGLAWLTHVRDGV